MKRYVITKEVLDIIHDADTDLNEIRRLIWSLPPIPEWATHFCAERPDENGEPFWSRQEIPK